MKERQMEGILWKWTNYWSGWQPRWFILDKGVLSYYKSQEEVNEGCRGSFALSVCDILVHPADICRLELNIPGEQRFYVKAATPKERQKWLIALGSAKAAADPVTGPGKKATKPDELRSKRSELRLYCDLLMQQVFTVKSAATEAVPDVEKLDEATGLLATTCDQFIQALEDLVQLSNSNSSSSAFTLEFPHQKVHDTPLPPNSPSVRMSPSSAASTTTTAMTSSPSGAGSSSSSPYSSSTTPAAAAAALKRSDHAPDGRRRSSTTSTSSLVNSPKHQQQQRSRNSSGQDAVGGGIGNENSNGSDSPRSGRNGQSLRSSSSASSSEPTTLRVGTFFTLLKNTFADIVVLESEFIPTEPFLMACETILGIFDRLESNAFSPIKQDMLGHIRKVEAKMVADQKRHVTLQAIVLSELNHDLLKVKNSATAALLWLTRGLWFIRELLWEVQQGGHDLVQSAHAAYSRTLRRHHSWVVRSVFAVALKAVPSRDVFLHALASTSDDTRRVEFDRQLNEDIANYIISMDRLLQVLDRFFQVNELESKVLC